MDCFPSLSFMRLLILKSAWFSRVFIGLGPQSTGRLAISAVSLCRRVACLRAVERVCQQWLSRDRAGPRGRAQVARPWVRGAGRPQAPTRSLTGPAVTTARPSTAGSVTTWCVCAGLKDCPRAQLSEPGAGAHLTRAGLGADARWSPPLSLPFLHPAGHCSHGRCLGRQEEGLVYPTDPPPVPRGRPAWGRGARCESEQRAASPARLHLDVCWLWLAFVPWPRRSRLKGTWRVQVRSGV